MNKLRFSHIASALLLALLLVPLAATVSPLQAQSGQKPAGSADPSGSPESQQGDAVAEEALPDLPELAEIIPLTSELSGRLVVLQNKLEGLLDSAAVEADFAGIEKDLAEPVAQLDQLKKTASFRLSRLQNLRGIIRDENTAFEATSKPLNDAIDQLGKYREEWLAERKTWSRWQSRLVTDEELDQFKSIFNKANTTIDTAVDLVTSRLDALLKIQERAGASHIRIISLEAELDGLIARRESDALANASPPMFSKQFISQFDGDLYGAAVGGVQGILWPDKQFLLSQIWTLLWLGLLLFLTSRTINRNRQVLSETKHGGFFSTRPYATALFLVAMLWLLINEFQRVPVIWKLATEIVLGIAFLRLSRKLIKAGWERQFVLYFFFVLFANRLMDLVNLPLPLFRLCLLSMTLAGIFFFLHWAKASVRLGQTKYYAMVLRLGALLLAVIMVAEIRGKETLAIYLFSSTVDSATTVLLFVMLTYIIHAAIELALRKIPKGRLSLFPREDIDTDTRHLANLVNVVIAGSLLFPAILMCWGIYDNLNEAVRGILEFGFTVGSKQITVSLLLVAAAILYGAFFTSWILQKLMLSTARIKHHLVLGARYSIARLLHYVIICAGFLIALSTLGVEITKITIMLSALGVGIGFGLQSVVHNFVSGLILLFEQPVRVGDAIELDGTWSVIKSIGLRATTVQTYELADVIIPNSQLISSQVVNWTLSNRHARLSIPVGAAYGSDVTRVMETLIACASDHPKLMKSREPQVLFQQFGDSTLNFELRVWVIDVDNKLRVRSELLQKIDQSFRDAGIEIAFPQLDLHLRSVDDSVDLRAPNTGGPAD